MNILFGLSFTIGKVMLLHGAPLFLVSVRMFISGILMILYSWFYNKKLVYPQKELTHLYIKQAVCGVFGFYALRSWALQFVSSSVAATIFSFFPLSTAIVSWYMHNIQYSVKQITGLSVGCLGVVHLVTRGSFLITVGFAESLIVLSVIFLSIGFIITQDLVKTHNNSPIVINGITMFIGGLLAIMASFYLEPIWFFGNFKLLITMFTAQLIISNIICSNLQTYLLKTYSPTDMACASFLAPLSTFVFGALLLDEATSSHVLFSLFVIISGYMLYHIDFQHYTSNVKIFFNREL